MVHFPFIWWWKIGITGKSATKRAKSIDKSMFGFPVPVFVVLLPGAFFVEQWLHREFSASNIIFYRGDGRTEWFWFWVAPIAFAVMLAIWGGYFALAGYLFGFDGFDFFCCFLQVIWNWAVVAFTYIQEFLK